MDKKTRMFRMSILGVIVITLTSFFWLYQSKKTAPTVSKQKQKVTVLLDWFPNTNHTGLYVAREKGYFTENNLEVDILQPGEGENTQVIASGKADFAISSQESVTLARAKDIPIVSLAAIIQHNTSAFASLKTADIESVKDFEKKRYGGWGSPIEEATLKAVMTEAGADYTKVKNITIGTSDFFATIGRDSDFQWIFYGWDGVEAKRRGLELNTIMLKDLNSVLDYYTPVLITNENHIREQKELLKSFMSAVVAGYEFASMYPEESSGILLKYAPELNSELVKESQKWVSSEYKKDVEKWGVQKGDVWKRYADWLYEHKLIEKPVDAEKAFTNAFIQ